MQTKTLRLLFLSFILINSISAQDKTGDIDFSLVDNAPTFFSQLELAKEWKSPNDRATPDLYHKNGDAIVGIPNNAAGTQEAYNGDSYGGIIAYSETSTTNYTEYIQNKFPTPLTKGKTYTFSFRTSLADKSGRALDGLGAYISKEAINNQTDFFIKASPQIVSGQVIKNKTEWVEISGDYTAKGGEQYITIGVFNKINKIISLPNVADNINKTRAYYYIDGIVSSETNIDSDKDGVFDKVDKCPQEKGPKENMGCPWGDSDKDGVLDNVDKCPKIKGLASRQGCPAPVAVAEIAAITAEAKAKLDEFARAIYFNSGKTTFKPGVADNLNRIAAIMKEYDTANFNIEGHTDSQGGSAPNQSLSERRAKAVLNYLSTHGITSSRLSSYGYGEDYPIADNNTRDGRAQNRRVQIKLRK